ncbi:MAG: DbpA RNA binding domain-containing protein [Gemmatimonadota bacterium]|nr:DbpA RNA binding domain-containing protein [Gemmatimonadota bacterium]MDE2985337.1 DbpA RNA binding domain-containing protein [Gemmatimonadota bacterium]
MTSFEDLPLGPETVAALAADGIETPTPFQAAAIPVIARGNDLMGRAGPGSGTLVGYGAPLLDRLEGGRGAPVCLVLCAGHRQATELARSFARLSEASGARAAALADHWLLPERADFLFVPADRVQALLDRSVDIKHVRALVLHDGDGVVKSVRADHLEAFLTGLPRECQRIFCGLPFGPALRSLAERFTHRAATVPPGPRQPARKTGKSRPKPDDLRELNLVVIEGDRWEAALALTANLLEDPVRHVLIFASSADQAADLGDFLSMHGYVSGPPGDEVVPVWISPGEDEAAREALDAMDEPETVATLSCSVPAGGAAASLRHASGGPAWVLAAVRETGHLKEVAADAGLRLRRTRPTRPPRVSATLDARIDDLHEAVRAPGMASYYLLVESLLDRFSAAEIAAAALLLLDRGGAKREAPAVGAAHASAPESWVRLFVSAGKRDDLGPGDLLGALTNQSGVPGRRVGRIDVRESHSLIEVRESDAKKVISAMNGITLGGRSLRVDYDRAKERRPVAKERQPVTKDRHSGAKARSPGAKSRQPTGKARSTGGRKPRRPGGKGWPPGGKTPRPGSK